MKCPYNPEMECRYVNTSGMDQEVSCKDCECYDKGIRSTGGCNAKTWIIALLIGALIWLIILS